MSPGRSGRGSDLSQLFVRWPRPPQTSRQPWASTLIAAVVHSNAATIRQPDVWHAPVITHCPATLPRGVGEICVQTTCSGLRYLLLCRWMRWCGRSPRCGKRAPGQRLGCHTTIDRLIPKGFDHEGCIAAGCWRGSAKRLGRNGRVRQAGSPPRHGRSDADPTGRAGQSDSASSELEG